MKAFNDMVNVNTTAFDALMEKAWSYVDVRSFIISQRLVDKISINDVVDLFISENGCSLEFTHDAGRWYMVLNRILLCVDMMIKKSVLRSSFDNDGLLFLEVAKS